MTIVRSPAARSAIASLVFVFLIGGCAGGPPPAAMTQSISMLDGLGRSVSLEGPAERIVSMAPSNTEILFALGAGASIVGRDEFSDYPEAAMGIPSIGGDFGDYNMEAIVAHQPDLVLAGGINTPDQIQSLQDLGLTVYFVANPLDFDGLYANLQAVGTLTGHAAEAEDLVDQLRTRVGVVTERLAGTSPVRVFFEVDGTDPSAPWSTGSGTFQDYLIRMAGGENVVTFEGWGQVNLEDLIASDPEVIFYSAAPYIPTTVESIAARPGWGLMTAVRNNAVIAVDTDLTDLPGPRWVDGLEAISRGIHPEAFE